MKGQYLAIETILTVGMGISIAIGSVSVFDSFRERTMQTGERAQAQIVRAQITNAAQALSSAESGEVRLQLPERVAGSKYSVTLGKNLTVTTRSQVYNFHTGFPSLDKSGQATGGPVNLIKREDELILRQS